MYRGAKLVCGGIFLHCQFLDNLTTVEVDVIMANSFTYFKFVSEHHALFSINLVEEEEKKTFEVV